MLLRYGRTIDNTRYKRAGFRYQYTSAGTVEAFAQGLRLAGAVGDNNPTYQYEREVEDFFRHSPAVAATGVADLEHVQRRRRTTGSRSSRSSMLRTPQRDDRADGQRDRRDLRRARGRRDDRRGRGHRRAARVLQWRRRRRTSVPSPPGRDDGERRQVASIYEGFLRVLRSSLPTVAAVNGPAVGAGMNLALACDVRIAGTSARFDARFLKIGLHPGGGHTWMLERAVGPQAAAAIVLFGEPSTARVPPRSDSPGAACADDELVEAALAFGGGAARVPRELSARAEGNPPSGPLAARLRGGHRHRGRPAGVVTGARVVRKGSWGHVRITAQRRISG